MTVRYGEPRSFNMFMARAVKPGGCRHQPEAVLDGLIETIIDRAAEILGTVGNAHRPPVAGDLRERASAAHAAPRPIARPCAPSAARATSSPTCARAWCRWSACCCSSPPACRGRRRRRGYQAEWRTALRDVQSIEEHATFLSSKVQFLLDATLGLVTIEQNDIIKLFSVMSVIFLPPTLVVVALRHELQAHARARMGVRLSLGHRC